MQAKERLNRHKGGDSIHFIIRERERAKPRLANHREV
jgi:hypothetical protein